MLHVGNQTYTQPLTVTLDPRVHVSQADLVQQLDTEKNISNAMSATYDAYDQVTSLRASIAERLKSVGNAADLTSAADALKALDSHAEKLEDGTPEDMGFGPINRELARLSTMVESGDARPAALLLDGVDKACEQLPRKLKDWETLNRNEIVGVNTLLSKSGFPILPAKSEIPRFPGCQ